MMEPMACLGDGADGCVWSLEDLKYGILAQAYGKRGWLLIL